MKNKNRSLSTLLLPIVVATNLSLSGLAPWQTVKAAPAADPWKNTTHIWVLARASAKLPLA